MEQVFLTKDAEIYKSSVENTSIEYFQLLSISIKYLQRLNDLVLNRCVTFIVKITRLVCSGCNMGIRGLLDVYALSLRASGIHVRQITNKTNFHCHLP